MALGLLAGLTAVLTVWNGYYRKGEAFAAGKAAGIFTSTITLDDSYHVTAAPGPYGHGVWIVVTMECTTSLMLAPVALLAAWAALQPRIRPVMTLLGFSSGLAILLALGTVRLAGIGLAFHRWGESSFWLTHNLVGSLISLFSAVIALAIQLKVMSLRNSAVPRSFDTKKGEERA
ncbi:exosortase/archaeosortase family protein [Streptomyces tubercidicus]